ncbi:c-type cytochrome [Zobellella taiwanensis]|jgi:cytochrome c553|uniref:Cytochrome c4 n=1 Tax=Zobellella taiwanensis TaxID=347535 RepID=A0A2P7QIN1_9GAMM|nr:c-type cytochrome [Zobellella taiwanensis]PSJ37828.1 cytochrome c4 [Zobellella taiwanensis]
MKKIIFTLALMLGVAGTAQAQGDVEAGKAKSATCVACHGNDGNSPADMYPKIAGQHASYIEKQLLEFKAAATGGVGRANAIMGGMVMPLSEQDMADLAAYYASISVTPVAVPEEVIEQGAALYQGGDMERGITACIACHGPRGEGLESAKFPRLSGQHPAYIKAQLELFRSGERDNDPNGMMRDIATKLTDQDIEILSQYVAGLR